MILTMVMCKYKQVKSCQHLGQVIIAAAVFPSAMSDKHEGPKQSIKVYIIKLETSLQRLPSCGEKQHNHLINNHLGDQMQVK